MKVLVLTHHWSPYTHHSRFSGYERIAFYLDEICDVDILTWRFGRIKEGINSELKVKRVFTPPTDILLERRLLLSLAAYFYAKRYDIVHALYSIPAFFPSFRYPTIATIHVTSDIDPKNIWLRYKTLLQQIIFKNVKYLITVSTNLKEILENKYNLKNVFYIPHGIDTQYFQSESIENGERAAFLSNKYDFISFTSGVNGTNLPLIFKISKQFPNILFLILGKYFQSHPPNVKFVSGVSDSELKKLYEIGDIFLKPLNFASANNSILEAMSMGRPIITDALPGVLDYLDDNSAYLLRTEAHYSEIISNALDNEKERKLRGINARKKAEKEFDWRVIAKKTYEIYEEVFR